MIRVFGGVLVLWLGMFFNLQAQIGFPYCETFQTPNTLNETIFGGDARLIGGVLRLTSNQNDQRGYVYINVPFPSSYGLKVEFEYFSYGGTGQELADGISMFLFDGDAPTFAPGGFGGSLGYAQRDGEPGLANAYLGIGFDEFGNFGNSSQGKVGGFSVLNEFGRAPNSIVLRGPGSGFSGYPFVVGRKTMEVGSDKDGLNPGAQFPISSGGSGTSRVTDPMQPGYRRVNLELQPDPDGVGFFLSLTMLVTTQPNLPRQVTIFERPFDFAAPKNLKIGFAASTGGFNNFHEIRNVKVEVSADDALVNPSGVDIKDFSSCAGQENRFVIEDQEVSLPNENSTIRCLQFFKSQEDISKNEGDICEQARCLEANRFLVVPQGVFQASDNAGGFTFTPNEEYIGQQVTVFYTITDNYGKTSDGNSITLDIKESPEPISIFNLGENEVRAEIEFCGDLPVMLEARGEEEYVSVEWLKDGQPLGNESSGFTLEIIEPGIYQVLGFNDKGCPAYSNEVKVLRQEPPKLLENLRVGCLPGESVDVSEIIDGFDLENFDYQLVGNSLTFLNEELKEIPVSGTYQLSVKSKAFTCFSDPIPLEVIIKEEELEVDFDFVVEGTDIRDDQSGGIFPDDPIVFTPLADLKAVSWSWDFGNGSISNTQNAIHVFGKKGEFPVTLTIIDELGCEASFTKTVSITRSYRVMVPTGFTPTEPENKTFLPKWKGIAEMELLIYNLWGELIFKTSDLETSGWDGTLSGKLLEPGLFVYQFRGKATDGEKVEESGKFRLIR